MRVLITGANGGLGLGLVEKFVTQGFEAIGIGRNLISGAKVEKLGAKFIAADLTRDDISEALENVDIIIHAAALSSPWGKYQEFFDINVATTQNLIKAAKNAGVGAFVFVSSPSVYARPMDQFNLVESDELPQNFMNHYAKTKAMAEKIVQNENAANFAPIIIRPRAIIGPNDNVLLPRFLRLINKGRFPLFNDGNALIEPTDVRDVANAIYLAAINAKNLGGEIFNISGGLAKPLKQMIELIAFSMKRDVKFINLNYEIVRPIIGAIEGFCEILPNRPEPPLTQYSLSALSFSQTFNLEKAQKCLNYAAQHNAFETAQEIARNLAAKS